MENTDWKRLSEMSDAKIDQKVLDDLDAQPTTSHDWKNTVWKDNTSEP